MAWIKLETHIFDKLEIFAIAEDLGIDPDSVVGKCCRIWSWFDLNTVNGVTPSVTQSLLDRYCGIVGFCDAMIKAGWMGKNENGLFLPNYDRHNSQTAKERALTAKRVSKHRKNQIINANSNGECNAKSNDKTLVKSLDREDKKREEEITKPNDVSDSLWIEFLAYRKKLKAPVTETVMKRLYKEASLANMPMDKVIETIIFKGWRSFDASWIKEQKAKDDYKGLSI